MRNCTRIALALLALATAGSSASALPLFGARTDYPTSSTPTSIAIGDLNADGKHDLDVACQFPYVTSVLFGLGSGNFGPFGINGLGGYSIAIGDLNGDGNNDVVTAVGGNGVSVTLGTGIGPYGAPVGYTSGSAAAAGRSVAIGDLNADGKLDLAVANYTTNTVSVLLGNGDGTFGPMAEFSTGAGPYSVAIGDLNGDGKPDLAVANLSSNSVSVLPGLGNGTFGAKTDFATAGGPISVAIGDLNGDAKRDLALANSASGSVSVLLGNGSGGFGTRSDWATGGGAFSVVIGDLNADGKPDLAVANTGANTVSVLPGVGDGTFGSKLDFATGNVPISVAIGDLNGDGRPDLAVANQASNTVSVLLASPDSPTPTLIELFRATATADGIRIEWQLSDPSAFLSIEVQRSTSEAGAWSRVQQAPQAQGRVTSVLDADTPAGQESWYRLTGTQRDGQLFSFGPISAVAQGTISAFALSPLSPNPSTGRSLVTFAVPTSTRVRLTLTDVQGREVSVLADGVREAGRYTAALEASDLGPGIYFVCMRAAGVTLTHRLVVLK